MAFALLLASLLSTAQTRTITGRLVDDKNEPVAGATINVKNTDRSTISDSQGRFSIDAAADAILRITFIGFEPVETKATDPTLTHLTLSRNTGSLDTILVTTALGIRRTRHPVVVEVDPAASEQAGAPTSARVVEPM